MTQQNELQNLSPVSFDAGLVFSGTNTGKTILGYDKPSIYTPKIDNNYLFSDTAKDVIVWLMQSDYPLYLYGPTGSGKTSLIKQLAAKINYPVFEVTGHARLELADLIGHHIVKNGSMSFEYGPLALAMKYGGLFLFNEIDLTSPDIAAGLNSILDGQALCIPENAGEIIQPSKMFKFVATANTNRASDNTGLYIGTLRQNLAFMDRFILCELGYPSPEQEKMMLKKMFTLPEEIIGKMVDYANEIRRLFMGENSNYTQAIELTLSTRTLIRWADLSIRYQALAKQGIAPINYALDRALAFRASHETRAMLHELVQRIFHNKTMHYNTIESKSELSDLQYFRSTILKGNIHLEMSTANGGKFWECKILPDRLELHWGKINTTGQFLNVSFNACVNDDPVLEAHKRCLAKLSKGYAHKS